MNRPLPRRAPLLLSLALLAACGGRSDLLDFVDPPGAGSGGAASQTDPSASAGSSQGGSGGAPSTGPAGGGTTGTGGVVDCSQGQLVQLADGQDIIGGIALDETSVYWSNVVGFTNTHVLKVAKSGGKPTLLASSKGQGGALVVDGTNVYWASHDSSQKTQVYTIAKDGSPANKKKLLTSTLNPVGALVLDSDFLYWTNGSGLISLPKDNGDAVDILLTGYSVRGLRIDQERLYWIDGVDTDLRSMPLPKGSGSPSLIASTKLVSYKLALDETRLYFSDRGGNRIVSVLKEGGPLTEITAVAPGTVVEGVTVDASCVYWNTYTDNVSDADHVWAAPKKGGPPVVITTGTRYGILVADETGVYWADYANGTLMRWAK